MAVVCPWVSLGVCSVWCALNRIDIGERERHTPLDPLRKPKDTPTHTHGHTPTHPKGTQGNPRGSTMPPPCVYVWEPRGSRGTLWGR